MKKKYKSYSKQGFITTLGWIKCHEKTLQMAIDFCCPFSEELIKSENRMSGVVAWRGAICIARYMNGYNQEEAGKSVNRDHASLINYLKNIEKELFTTDFRIVGNIRMLTYYIEKMQKVKCNECKFELNK